MKYNGLNRMKTDIKIELSDGTNLTIDLAEEDLSWEVVDTDEREMGVERLYEAVLEKEIEGREEPVVINLRVWEYPEGIANMQEFESDDCTVIEECDLGQFVITYNDEDDEDF